MWLKWCLLCRRWERVENWRHCYLKHNPWMQGILHTVDRDDVIWCHCVMLCHSVMWWHHDAVTTFRLKSLTNQAPIMVFMKGSPEVGPNVRACFLSTLSPPPLPHSLPFTICFLHTSHPSPSQSLISLHSSPLYLVPRPYEKHPGNFH